MTVSEWVSQWVSQWVSHIVTHRAVGGQLTMYYVYLSFCKTYVLSFFYQDLHFILLLTRPSFYLGRTWLPLFQPFRAGWKFPCVQNSFLRKVKFCEKLKFCSSKFLRSLPFVRRPAPNSGRTKSQQTQIGVSLKSGFEISRRNICPHPDDPTLSIWNSHISPNSEHCNPEAGAEWKT